MIRQTNIQSKSLFWRSWIECTVYAALNFKRKSLFVIFLIIIHSSPVHSTHHIDENILKSVYLYKLLKFIEWPEAIFEDKKSAIKVCLLGDTGFPKQLFQRNGSLINNRPVHFVEITSIEPFSDCQALFISKNTKGLYEKILKETHQLPILTVSDDEKFIDTGGMIGLILYKDNLQIEINKIVADEVHIDIRASLMEIAKRRVVKKSVR